MPRGDWIRTNIKTRCEEVHQLDINDLNVIDGRGEVEVYTSVLASIQVHYWVDDERMIIFSHGQLVHLDRTPCHYGGHRKWFLCPQCNERTLKLYEWNSKYLCRKCHDLPYTSQRVPEIDRLLIKVRKIRDRLNASHDLLRPVMFKPKGMHWGTFEKLKIDEKFADYDCTLAMAKKLYLLGGRRSLYGESRNTHED